MFGKVLATSQASPVRNAPTTASCMLARTTPRTREAMVPAAIPAVDRARLASSLTGSDIEGDLLCGGAGRTGGATPQGTIGAQHEDDASEGAQNPVDPGARGLHAHIHVRVLPQRCAVGRGEDRLDGHQPGGDGGDVELDVGAALCADPQRSGLLFDPQPRLARGPVSYTHLR